MSSTRGEKRGGEGIEGEICVLCALVLIFFFEVANKASSLY
jgi:hypothetical protein